MKRAQRFVVNVTCFSGTDMDVIFTLPASIVSTRSSLSPRVYEEPASGCVVVIPTTSSEAAAAPISSSLQGISIDAIIVVVVVDLAKIAYRLNFA